MCIAVVLVEIIFFKTLTQTYSFYMKNPLIVEASILAVNKKAHTNELYVIHILLYNNNSGSRVCLSSRPSETVLVVNSSKISLGLD